jgi:imidazolonepropionase-like amidohydrolase
MRPIATIALSTLVIFAASAAPVAAQSVTAYEGARVIVGDGRVIDNATLIVDGTKLSQVGAAVHAPAGAKRVDLRGKTVMPAIVDTHVHLSTTREALLRDLRQRAYWGVSAALSLGLDGFELLDVRGQALPGTARFFSAGRGITMPEPGRTTAPFWVTSAAEGRKAVDENAAHKVDIVKIWVDTREGKFKKLSPDVYGAIIDEAHQRGLRVIAHLFDLEDAKGLVRAGVDALAHGVRDKDIDDEFVALFKARPNLILTPNLPERGVKTDLSWLKAGLAPEEYAKLEKANVDNAKAQTFYAIQARNLARLNAAGARIVLGTDGNKPWGPHEEMEDMVAAGMTPAQVLAAATRNGAAFLGMADAGTLEAGKSADFIVLDANPVDDIRNTRRIAAVVLRGAAVDRSQPPR